MIHFFQGKLHNTLYFKIIFFCFLLSGIQNFSFGQTQSREINKLQEQLAHAIGRVKVNLLNRLIGAYQPIDSVKSYDYFKRAIILCEKHNYDTQEYNAYIYLTGGFNAKNQHYKAINTLKKTILFAQENNLPKAIGFANSDIGEQYLFLNDYQNAEKYQQKALQLFTKSNSAFGRSVAYERLGLIYMTKNNIEKNEHEISQQNTIIKQKKKQIFLLIVIGILLLILLTILIVFIVISKQQREKILLKENIYLQKELDLKNKDLVYQVSMIFTKNQVINRVAQVLINSSDDFKHANRKLIRGIVRELKQNMDETGWQEFEMRFAQVHQGFYNRLDKQFPDLTKTERKLCALLKLGMSSKEIAAITMTRCESVDTGRSRLRKKLGLTGDDNLFEFLNKL